MIPRRYIDEWRMHAPWPENAQVEQDLIIERALIEIFSDAYLREHLSFRGGTALHKFYLRPQARYSEDIDLVQIKPGPIKPILVKIRERVSFLGNKRKVEQSAHNNTIIYSYESEIPPVSKVKLKIEINTREHFTVLEPRFVEMSHMNGWFSGVASIQTFELEELLGSKLRALYQRRKGRDLFDIYYACKNLEVNVDKLIYCYKKYMSFDVEKPPSKKMFIANTDEKLQDSNFLNDIHVILRPEIPYDNQLSYAYVKREILNKL